jgi:hypothetical protein
MAELVQEVEHFIALDRQSIRLQVIAGVVLVAIGIAVLLSSGAITAVAGGGASLDIATKAAGFLNTLAGFYPFNGSWTTWQQMKTLEAMKANPQLLESEEGKALVNKLYQKFLGV